MAPQASTAREAVLGWSRSPTSTNMPGPRVPLRRLKAQPRKSFAWPGEAEFGESSVQPSSLIDISCSSSLSGSLSVGLFARPLAREEATAPIAPEGCDRMTYRLG